MERKITIEEEKAYKEDYQIWMIQMNEIDGILPMKGRGMDGKSCYDYNVSGKISMKALYERSKISGKDIKIFLKQLKNTICELEKHLLNIHCMLLDPEYVFYEDEKFYFCYYPLSEKNVWEEFHTLTEYFVKQADYEDKECVRMVFLLHKETMKENYSLEKLITDCMKDEEVETEVEEFTYDTEDHDWITAQELGSSILKETDNMWKPMKNFLNRHKRPRWGEWDEIYIDEEEWS